MKKFLILIFWLSACAKPKNLTSIQEIEMNCASESIGYLARDYGVTSSSPRFEELFQTMYQDCLNKKIIQKAAK